MHTILGAGGAIGTDLVKALTKRQRPVRLVGRRPQQIADATETVAADLSQLDQTIDAVAGSEVVYLLVGLKYDARVWAGLWPRIMHNAIEACKRAQAKLVFFDTVYPYGRADGPMTEDTPFNPCSRKGEIRARIATTLLDEIKAGKLQALIARSADFYGPRVKTSILNILVIDKLARGAAASWLVNDAVPHSFTFTPDAAESLAMLADTDAAWNQTWHVPTAAPPLCGKEYIQMAAQALGVAARHHVLGRRLIKMAGWFNSDIHETYEMLYQNESAYRFDSSKFERAFAFEPTSYLEGIRRTADACRSGAG
ncbi:MAG: NAD-dependent epimerase/dehydratase family protein [Hydrogenophilales bacterium]|nr:NAD-dependent epimerase/dehydratase family protein [Hydrogenophilales bacterium]